MATELPVTRTQFVNKLVNFFEESNIECTVPEDSTLVDLKTIFTELAKDIENWPEEITFAPKPPEVGEVISAPPGFDTCLVGTVVKFLDSNSIALKTQNGWSLSSTGRTLLAGDMSELSSPRGAEVVLCPQDI